MAKLLDRLRKDRIIRKEAEEYFKYEKPTKGELFAYYKGLRKGYEIFCDWHKETPSKIKLVKRMDACFFEIKKLISIGKLNADTDTGPGPD